MNECGRVAYIHRVDSARYCTIVRFMFPVAVVTALKIKRVAEENVYITRFTERKCFFLYVAAGCIKTYFVWFSESYLSDMAPIPEVTPKSSLRLYKESLLRKLIEKEDQKEMSRVRTIPNNDYRSPNPEFYKNEGGYLQKKSINKTF